MHDIVGALGEHDPFDDDELISRALSDATRDALRMHRALGNPIVVMQGGKIVWIPPEQIPQDGAFPPEAHELPGDRSSEH